MSEKLIQENEELESIESPKDDSFQSEEEEITEEEYNELRKEASNRGENPDDVQRTRKVKSKKRQSNKSPMRKSTILLGLDLQIMGNDYGIIFISQRITEYLDSFEETMWQHDIHSPIANKFMTSKEITKLFVWIDENGLRMSEVDPPQLNENSYDQDFAYFIKSEIPNGEVISQLNVSEYVMEGLIQSNYLKILLKQMNIQFIPQFMSDTSWPENVKKEFLSQLHRFMATLTEYSHQQEGFTELYIPNEDLSNINQASHDKDLLQRLEATLLHWYRQIKDIVNNQDSQQDNENAGPLDEIAYWRSRKSNLSHIHQQLDKPELKRIIQILTNVDSQYVKSFEDVTENIKIGSVQAENNLEFLRNLYEPCKQLESASPREIPDLLPSLLYRVRLIWEFSKHYNTQERISGLLHKISNEIIKRCKQSINIDDMLDGDVEKCMQDLRDSIECGKKWKKIYDKTAQVINKKAVQIKGPKWEFNLNSIFAQIDAFVQRCTELIEICEGQLQFARKGADSHIPQFGGSRGPEIEHILEEIKESFGKHLMKIKGTDKDKILDVKASKWHDEFSTFKNGVKDLDVMYQNIINFAFDSVATVQQGVEMLEAFDQLAKRETIKLVVKKKALYVMQLFSQELDASKQEFDNMKKPGIQIPIGHGKYSGQCIWVRGQIHRIEKIRDWIDKMVFVDDSIKKPQLEKYEQVYQSFRLFVVSKHKEWKEENKDLEDAVLVTKLDRFVLYRPDDKSPDIQNKKESLRSKIGHLESNFDRQILRLMNEVVAWKKLLTIQVVIPPYADDFTLIHRENLRVLREQVLLVVRDFNNIIDYMNDTERKLFKQHLEQVEKVIYPGQARLRWSAKNILDGFVRECRRACNELFLKLKMFKTNTERIEQKCNEIAQRLLIKIDRKKVYDCKMFEEEQERHRKDMYNKLKIAFDEIKRILCETYEPFVFDRLEIQRVWFRYVQQIDAKIEDSFKKAVKNSLLDLQKVVGDDKINPIPIFKLSVELENQQLEFRPSTEQLIQMITQTMSAMTGIMRDFKRMELIMQDERKKRIEEAAILKEKDQKNNPLAAAQQKKQEVQTGIQFDEDLGLKKMDDYLERISDDQDVQKYTTKILDSLRNTCQQLITGESRDPWKKTQWYWSNSNFKDKYAKEMLSRNDPVTNLKTQIENYEFFCAELQATHTTAKQGCIILDNTSIKSTIVDIMILWQNALLKAIEDKALQDLNSLYALFQNGESNLSPVPQDLHQLKKNMDLWNKLTEDKSSVEAKIVPLEDKFKLLGEYSMNLKEEDNIKRMGLVKAWQDFNLMLDRIQIRNTKVHNDLYLETQKGLDEFVKETNDSRIIFTSNAPYQANNMDNEKAFALLTEYKEQAKSLRKREELMKFGFDLFTINYVPSPELEFMEKEIANLEDVWNTKEKWDQQYKQFCLICFKDVNYDQLDEEAEEYIRKLNQYPKETKKWEIVNFIKTNIDSFRQTLPLIQMLREKYMRDRHWEKLKQHLGALIEPESETFTLNDIFKMNLISYADAVREVCDIAREEFKIESAMDKIEKKWVSMELEMDPFKKTYKIKKAEEIFTVLEENMGTLSAQKTTLFYDSFKTIIESWENILQQISETLEMLLQVQRQWLYLESIFASQQQESEKQLVGDISKFQAVHQRLAFHMNRIFEDRNVKRALCIEGFLNDLQDMSRKLDDSQKILYQLLERQRKDFPRFYFLSNDDLFELLGNSKDVYKVNKHIKKCFEGIKKFDILTLSIPSGRTKIDVFEVAAMISPEGESVKFSPKVPCEQQLEKWLQACERMMRDTLKKELLSTLGGIRKKEQMRWVEKWVREHPGQLLITASQINWSSECFTAITNIYNSEKQDKNRAWRVVKDEKKDFLNELTKLVRKNTGEVDRLKLVALITIEVHNRDIIESLIKTCFSPTSFEWLKQLRFSGITQGDAFECKCDQTNTSFPYGYEYQGNNGRLVVTALTDRCYMTLTTAMVLKKGGAPQGPAGTGKTETVKDLGKTMAKFVLVFNCSEGLDYKSIGRMFSGLVQTGGWGCFDEFNRIEVEVLSVVAQQMSQIMNALKEYEKNKDKNSFQLEAEVIQINDQVAIFITMNPGYAGRSELPDNLKSLFRPMSMMVPDSGIICEIMLQSEGFVNGRPLATKMVTLYNLMTQQLSKQDHYDFGLRAIKSVLICAGQIRREKSQETQKEQVQGGVKSDNDRKKELEIEEANQETIILMRAIRDMNMPKFVGEDVPLFNALFNDLFPNMDIPENVNEILHDEIEIQMKLMKLQPKPELVSKIIQLYDSKNTRHGNMLVGESLSGKSSCWKVLQKTMCKLNEKDPNKYPKVKLEILNPKSVSINELFGFVNNMTMEWNEGVLSSMMSRLCKDESNDQRWMILDGPVDTFWIESMNTVLDDNKVLTLLNGDRISLPQQVGLIFEVNDLSVASPATVSRAGMIYLDINELGWRPYLESWIEQIRDTTVQEYLWEFVEKWIPILFKQRKLCKELIQCSECNLIISMCNLMDCFVKSEQQLNFNTPNKTEIYWNLLEKWFAFAIVWSIGATVDEDGRKMIDYKMRDIESMFPHSNTIYDYFINNDKNEWASWDEKIGAGVWKPASNLPYHKMLVPTTDSIRNRYILNTLLRNKKFALAVGLTGTGKSVVINGILQELDDSFSSQNIVFSSQTNSFKTQEMIESRLVKRSKNKMIPDGKKLVIFIDDLNMPRKDTFGSQPALELLRQWIDYEGWFDRTARDLFKYILDIQFIAAMGPPGGGRADISKRIQTKFNVINFTFPSDTQVRRIFQSILTFKFQEFDEEIKPLAETLTLATYNLFKNIQDNFLPTPAKSHYLFNMRDISKVIQGVYQLDRFYCDNKMTVLRMWVHENLRVFHDRLINVEDRILLKKLISDQLEQNLQTNMKDCTNEIEEDTIFADFMEESGGKYVEVPYKERENLKKFIEERLKDYNEKTKASSMNLVLFQEAIQYVCKINRIIKLGKGHGMLVGEGGAGRHSLTKLASFIAEYSLWQIEVSKNYRMKEFREDIKKWCEETGFKNRSGVFLFSDNQILNEGFIEDINNILTVGEVPNLFNSKEDYPQIKDRIRKEYIRELNLDKDARILDDDLMEFFFTRIQSNFHVMLLMSKTGDNLRNYCRMYPGLVNNTTMIWFMAWPQEALIEVANRYLLTLQLPADLTDNMAIFFGMAHTRVLDLSQKMWLELKRRYFVTPTNYIELVKGYNDLLKDKKEEIGGEVQKLALGLQKLDDAASNSEELQKMLSIYQIELSKKSKDCEDLMIKIESEQREANEKQKEVEIRSAQVDKEKAEIEVLANDAQLDLEKAEPALRTAESGLENLKKDQLAEVRAYNKPPPGVDGVLQAIMILMGKEPSWASAKKELTAPDFLSKLKNIDKDHILQKTLLRIEKITHDPEMSLAKIDGISSAAGQLWRWVLAMELYSKAFKDIEPKRAKVKMLREKLKKSEDELQSLRDNFEKLKLTIVSLNNSLLKSQQDMQTYSKETTLLQTKLERADKLISGLASTKQGWVDRRKQLEDQLSVLVGDALLSAAFLSYCGPFPSEYREVFVKQGMSQVKQLKIPYSKDYSFADFLVRPVEFLKWSFQGLPDDQFSKENGVLVTKGRRWPLMIDPQMQANKWIKQMEREIDEKNVVILDPQSDKLMNQIEVSISVGKVVILQNIYEEIDPAIEPILNKSLKMVANKYVIYLGEKEVAYNMNFRFYMTTKLSNPNYKAETSTRVTFVNFTVKQKGLEEQLISVVIQKIEISLEKSKNDLVTKKAQNESKLRQLDDAILRQLQETKGSLIDDENLIKNLEKSKETEEEVRHQIETSAVQMKKTFAARENYRSLARIASKLFFIINNFSLIDNMYQFALDNYIQQFGNNIDNYLSKGPSINDSLQEKLQDIASKHCEEVFKYSCRGLFEKDKLLLGLQMSVGLVTELKPQIIIDQEEFNFFLRGQDVSADRKGQLSNPCTDWIYQSQWDAICDLDKMKNFTGIIGAFTHNGKEWKRWYLSATPESDQLPGEWDQKCDELRKLIVLKIIRPDRILFAAQTFVNASLGSFYTSPPSITYESIYADSNKQTPVIFILSPGVDPFHQLDTFAKSKQTILIPVSLGQGQAQKAIDKLFEGAKNGFWLYLANCHLSMSFLKELEKSMEQLELKKNESHDNFRLWLSSSPHPQFPISILQKCIKVTTEPPKGVKANMYRQYTNMPADKYQHVQNKNYYKKLVFSLCWYHAIIIERKRFKSLGWNIIYDFNDSDWETADNILQMYVDQSSQDKPQQQQNQIGNTQTDQPQLKSPPWDAIKYLISEVTYGGRVTDEWDRRLLNVYATQQFNDKVIFEEKHKLVDGTNPYTIPEELSQKEVKNHEKIGSEPLYYRSKIDDFPGIERPDVFGQHINAEISSQITDSNALIDSIMALSPRTVLSGEESRESKVGQIIKEVLDKLPQELEISEVIERVKPQDQNPLKIVLMQEITRYNKLLSKVRNSLINVDKGISGLVLISEELEMVMQSLYEYRVPESWKFCYHSMKSLYQWVDDLIKRVDQVRNWAMKSQPSVFWISGFSFPTGFTTALLQQSARRLNIPIDQFGWEYSFLPFDSQPSSAKEGAYINGLFLEGAKWDEKNYIVDADPMKLFDQMPIIHFKPVYFEGKAKQKKGQNLYACPTYMYPIRAGIRERPSFQFSVMLPCKPNAQGAGSESDFWVKRGTALLMSLGD